MRLRGTVFIKCRGHPNVQLLHDTTLEATVEDRLTPRGDCIVCVSAKIHVNGACKGYARGYIIAINPFKGLEFKLFTGVAGDCRKPIIRRSSVCENSLVCKASIAASILRSLRPLLQSPFTQVYIMIWFYET